ncbi:putative Holliday junction resolvase [Sulfurovum sp. enrichment culture clone C5]|uniref:Putative pre-16S rRNA nuclease n=1 Tax=Sulfurovum sp. enrichment culture clone C5 TaxID=497650 RepID=A0A0S4XLG0_9BACT|nr:putative Holliday junction resolvase [Sulfurovum sp. enrichment culture clone C5]
MKIASIDIGLKRIGIALSDGNIVMPQNPIIRKNRNQASKDLKEFLTNWHIEKLIVGIPIDGSSTEEMKRRIEHFISLLDLSIPVIYQDEQNSSQEAKERSAGVFKHSRDGKIDSLAAVIILERYLNSEQLAISNETTNY